MHVNEIKEKFGWKAADNKISFKKYSKDEMFLYALSVVNTRKRIDDLSDNLTDADKDMVFQLLDDYIYAYDCFVAMSLCNKKFQPLSPEQFIKEYSWDEQDAHDKMTAGLH